MTLYYDDAKPSGGKFFGYRVNDIERYGVVAYHKYGATAPSSTQAHMSIYWALSSLFLPSKNAKGANLLTR